MSLFRYILKTTCYMMDIQYNLLEIIWQFTGDQFILNISFKQFVTICKVVHHLFGINSVNKTINMIRGGSSPHTYIKMETSHNAPDGFL